NVSIANIIALIGLAGIGVVTFFGMLLHSSDGKPAGAILGAVALVAVLGFLLFMSIKAKGAEDNPDKWRYVEWACLAAYVIVALIFASPFQRFFYILGEKDSMQVQARQEIKAIKNMYQEYDHQQKKYLNDAVEQIQNYIASGQQKNIKDDLAEYVKGIGSNVDGWAAKASAKVKLAPDKQLSDIEDKIEGWNIMQLSPIAVELENKDSEAWTIVEKKILKFEEQNKLIPVIGGGGGHPYTLDGYAKFNLGDKPDAKFAQMLRNSDGSTITGWIIYIILNLLVLLNYAVAPRNILVRIHQSTTGGLDL
ncbi:MAG: hypothetical protein J5965_18495, partial [Aeriscardovia sp.]|nr:hypothetical protein [Aeriscardovia sp.]